MNKLISVLMRRDGLTREEATDLACDAREAVLEAIDDGDDPEEVFMDLTGLEPDFILDIVMDLI